jgi:hypothetical protein
MAFEDLNTAREKLGCEESTSEVTNFFVANGGTLSDGVALFTNSSLGSLVADGVYVLSVDNTIFKTFNGIVEVLQIGE